MKLILRLRRYQSQKKDIRVVLRGLDEYKIKEFIADYEKLEEVIVGIVVGCKL